MAREERVIAGRYRLRKRLGSGGGGAVWLAEDEALRVQVAVKEIDVPREEPEATGDDRAGRGRREALKAAQLREHPNVITVYDVVEDDGRPWIVMEYLPGTRDLRAAVKERGPLAGDEVARIGAAALDALRAGHGLGIIHRDVKPSNILLAPDHSGAADRRVLLTDYGISLWPRETRVTQSGMVVGTPGYLAPERLSGGEATRATDLFSLGVTLYFAVEGVSPFERDTLDASLLAALNTEPDPPKRADERLSRVIMGLLAKKPADRIPPEEARELLAAAAEPATVPGQPSTVPGAPARTPGSGRRAPNRRTAALLAAAAVLVGGGGFALGATTSGDEETTASKPKAVAAPSPTVTRGIHPYGSTVGLREGLDAGQCVDADWKGGEFRGQPALKTVDCYEDDPEGQVVATVPADGPVPASDQQAVRNDCTRRTAELRGTMADPVLYVLTPAPGQSEPPASACLLFLKKATLGGPLGDFRKYGDEVYVTTTGPGDCVDVEEDEDGDFTETLVSCTGPHDEQMIGWLWASGDGSADSVETGTLCEEKYGVNWARGEGHEMWGWRSSDEEWDGGFRHVLCSVAREDGKKLPGGALKPAY
ncbi:serine/threonine-protein kinase [Streptomyces sp. NPDC088387]|uniref:serine/threonine-protein kinase n=1 Tax=Streptomyces sp. NPDC088387 TaxID=3365859 RepID=UPI00382FFC80